MFDPKKLKPKNPKIEKIANLGRKTSQLSFASIFSPIGPKLGEIEANYCKKLGFLTKSDDFHDIS